MLEICKSGSEGGARQTNVPFLPLSALLLSRRPPLQEESNSIQLLVLGKISSVFSSTVGGGGRSHLSMKGIGFEGFVFTLAADVLDDDAGEEGEGVEVGFGFGDGYDFAIEVSTCDLVGVAYEAALVAAAVKADALQLRF